MGRRRRWRGGGCGGSSAAAVEQGRVRWVVGGGGAAEGAGGRRRRRGSGQRGELARGWRERDEGDLARGRELARGNLTNGAPARGAP